MSEAVPKTTSLFIDGEHYSLEHQIALVASIHSTLRSLGIEAEEVEEHLYDLLASWIRTTPYEYIEGLIELSTHKSRDISDMINIYGERGLEVILSALRSPDCSGDEEETLLILMDDLGVSDEVRHIILEKARTRGCIGIKSAAITLLITPSKG